MSWLAPDGTVLDKMPVNKYVTKEGEFIAPYRLPNESQKDYNKRLKKQYLYLYNLEIKDYEITNIEEV